MHTPNADNRTNVKVNYYILNLKNALFAETVLMAPQKNQKGYSTAMAKSTQVKILPF